MAVNKRERILAAATGSLLVLVLMVYLLIGSGGTLAELQAERDKKQAELSQKQLRVRRGEKAKEKLRQWELRALPADEMEARRLYHTWLTSLVDDVKFRDATINSREGQRRRNAGIVLPLTVGGHASLEQLTRVLYMFYSAGHFHQIRRAVITPQANGEKLEVNLTIEGFSLASADRRDKLSAQPPLNPPATTLPKYQEAIVARNVFAPYSQSKPPVVARKDPPKPPPKPPEPPPSKPPSFDHTKYAVLTGITEVDGKPEAWVLVQTTGKQLFLGEGQSFDIEGNRGKVVRIGHAEAEFSIDGKRRLVPKGGNLHDGNDTPAADGSKDAPKPEGKPGEKGGTRTADGKGDGGSRKPSWWRGR